MKAILFLFSFFLIGIVSANCIIDGGVDYCCDEPGERVVKVDGIYLCLDDSLDDDEWCCLGGGCDSWDDYWFCDKGDVANCFSSDEMACCPDDYPAYDELSDSCWKSDWDCINNEYCSGDKECILHKCEVPSECSSNYDCGYPGTHNPIGYCSDGDVYGDKIVPVCENSFCIEETRKIKLKDCNYCMNGDCVGCITNSDCVTFGTMQYVEPDYYCRDGNVYYIKNNRICGNEFECIDESSQVFVKSCPFGCLDGICQEFQCDDGEIKCSGNSTAICQDNKFIAGEICKYGCLDGECIQKDYSIYIYSGIGIISLLIITKFLLRKH